MAACALRPAEEDVALGGRIAAAIEAQAGLYADAPLQRYVKGVAQRVAAQLQDSLFEYRFAVADQPEPNAFAAPGGFVFVSRGLLAIANSEDELAGVLGHETTHVEQRHSAELMRPRVLGSILSLPGNVIGLLSPQLGDFANAPVDTLRALQLARYGRGQESESDRVGQQLAAAAGYDPAALAAILDRMKQVVEQLTGQTTTPTYFDTHPPTATRVDDIRVRARELPSAARSPDARDDAAFLQALDGLVWGDNPARGLFRDTRYLAPSLGIAITFPEGWQTSLTASFAGASAPAGETAVVFSVPAKTTAELQQRAATAKATLRADGFELVRDDEIAVDGYGLRLLEYRSADGSRVVLQGWVALDGAFGEFSAVGAVRDAESLRNVITSMRSLDEAERDSVRVLRIRIVPARAGETLQQLHRRAGGAGSVALHGALNGLPPAATLAAGKLVKVVRSEAFP